MGIYFNPSNESFKKDRNYKIYVDKTELLEYLNELVETPKNCVAVAMQGVLVNLMRLA